MINVKMTILETIKDKIKKLRLLGQNNPKVFKKILSLIILDDLCEWSDYLDVPQSVQKKLQDMRNNYILCNRDFIIEYGEPLTAYVNVNTPQTNDTWKRVWDSENLFDPEKFEYINLSTTTVSQDQWIHVPKFAITEDGYIKAIGNYVYPSDFDLFDTIVSQDGFIHTEEVPMSQEHILMNSYSIDNENYLIH